MNEGYGEEEVGRANCSFFFFNDTATTEIYTLSLHDALPISAATKNGQYKKLGRCRNEKRAA